MKNTYRLLALSIFLFLGCTKDRPVTPVPDPESTQIATFIRLDFLPVDGGTPAYMEASYDKQTGSYITKGDNLRHDKSYTVNLTLEDRRLTPAKDIKSVIAADAKNYQIFYTVSDATKLDFSYNDMDSNGLPIGISTKVKTGSVSLFTTLTITIKYAPGKKDGNINTGTTVFETFKLMSIL